MADSNVYAQRVARFREIMSNKGWDVAVVHNNADLRWLMGTERVFDFEDAHTAVITQEHLWLHTDSRYYNTFLERLGDDHSWELDEEPMSHPKWVAKHILELGVGTVAIEDTLELWFYDALKKALAEEQRGAYFPRMHEVILGLRVAKDAEEIEIMKTAQKITDETFTHMCEFIKPGMTEKEIRQELENYMFSHGADALSFDTIIASGPNGANPHAQPGDRKVEKGDFIVMDYGAGLRDYHSDMTRTVCLGEPTDEQRKVYDIVRQAHEECAAMIKAGVIGSDIHNHAVKVISDAGYGDYFKHGLGHSVGIEIHENPRFNSTWDKPIPAGCVITDEPGIYLPGKFGVRLEDFGVVTEEGYEPFTQSTHELVCIPC